MNVVIKEIKEHKEDYMSLLLIGDEQEDMIERYLDRGRLFAALSNSKEAVGVMVLTDEGDDVAEIKNLAVLPKLQRRGIGRELINYAANLCREDESYTELLVGTGEAPGNLTFYKKCGFEYSHRIKDFFKDNYDHTIAEEGVELCDMIYLSRKL